MALDQFDRQLLNLVQTDARLSAEQLAEHIPLSPSAIHRRLRRLRETGVIVRDIAVVDPKKVGRPNFFVVSIQVERERPELLNELRRWMAKERRIQHAFYVTGESDFVIIVAAPDTETYDELMARLMGENPNVKRFTTNVALSVVKRDLAIEIPVDEED